MNGQLIEADRVWTGRTFEMHQAVRVGADGTVLEIGSDLRPADGERRVRLPGRALLPGFVNAHSHAFQRGLRGRGERFPRGAGSFWTWREAMYELVASLDPDRFRDLCIQAFREMLAAGMTTVGEFHYFHHLSDEHDFAADSLVLEAAREAGIRIVLLYAYYRTGGIGSPLQGGQTRFSTPSLDLYRKRLDALSEQLDPKTQSLGIVAHSIRAVDLDELEALHREACDRGWVFHMHLEEQRQEIAACREAYGKTPMEVVLDRVDPAATPTTAVHCTHTEGPSMERYLDRGGRVCICPLTEANLADGIADLPTMADGIRQNRISLGSDSNARISMLEEMRWLEYVQRLALERRGVVTNDDGLLGPNLLNIATRAGARSLGLPVGSIEPGQLADLLTLDLGHPSLALVEDEHLLDALILGAADGAIDKVCVGGTWKGLFSQAR